jgi:hypothetical protein
MSIIKELTELIKQKRQFEKDLRRLEHASLDYEALQRIVNNAASSGVTVTITFENGTKMEIKRANANETNFKPFSERYKEQK